MNRPSGYYWVRCGCEHCRVTEESEIAWYDSEEDTLLFCGVSKRSPAGAYDFQSEKIPAAVTCKEIQNDQQENRAGD